MKGMTLVRSQKRPDGIISDLTSSEDDFGCVTMEHSYDGEPKLPPGLYPCVRGKHRLHGMEHEFETFEITQVPGHTGILFHVGNFNGDSDGCVCVGRVACVSPHGYMVTNSVETFTRFMAYWAGENTFLLTVVDPVNEESHAS